eukprot:SAG22_NODE_575_length_8991_cov_12.134859_2_plen_122_part_00
MFENQDESSDEEVIVIKNKRKKKKQPRVVYQQDSSSEEEDPIPLYSRRPAGKKGGKTPQRPGQSKGTGPSQSKGTGPSRRILAIGFSYFRCVFRDVQPYIYIYLDMYIQCILSMILTAAQA